MYIPWIYCAKPLSEFRGHSKIPERCSTINDSIEDIVAFNSARASKDAVRTVYRGNNKEDPIFTRETVTQQCIGRHVFVFLWPHLSYALRTKQHGTCKSTQL
jgi:hypothetical protein